MSAEPTRDRPLAHVEHPRCPFCHEGVRPEEEKHACLACMAWHHQGCVTENQGRCATCGAGVVSPVASSADPALPASWRAPVAAVSLREADPLALKNPGRHVLIVTLFTFAILGWLALLVGLGAVAAEHLERAYGFGIAMTFYVTTIVVGTLAPLFLLVRMWRRRLAKMIEANKPAVK